MSNSGLTNFDSHGLCQWIAQVGEGCAVPKDVNEVAAWKATMFAGVVTVEPEGRSVRSVPSGSLLDGSENA